MPRSGFGDFARFARRETARSVFTALDMSEKMITGIMHGFREFLCFGRSASTEMHKLESSAGIRRNYGVVETEISEGRYKI